MRRGVEKTCAAVAMTVQRLALDRKILCAGAALLPDAKRALRPTAPIWELIPSAQLIWLLDHTVADAIGLRCVCHGESIVNGRKVSLGNLQGDVACCCPLALWSSDF